MARCEEVRLGWSEGICVDLHRLGGTGVADARGREVEGPERAGEREGR